MKEKKLVQCKHTSEPRDEKWYRMDQSKVYVFSSCCWRFTDKQDRHGPYLHGDYHPLAKTDESSKQRNSSVITNNTSDEGNKLDAVIEDIKRGRHVLSEGWLGKNSFSRCHFSWPWNLAMEEQLGELPGRGKNMAKILKQERAWQGAGDGRWPE